MQPPYEIEETDQDRLSWERMHISASGRNCIVLRLPSWNTAKCEPQNGHHVGLLVFSRHFLKLFRQGLSSCRNIESSLGLISSITKRGFLSRNRLSHQITSNLALQKIKLIVMSDFLSSKTPPLSSRLLPPWISLSKPSEINVTSDI